MPQQTAQLAVVPAEDDGQISSRTRQDASRLPDPSHPPGTGRDEDQPIPGTGTDPGTHRRRADPRPPDPGPPELRPPAPRPPKLRAYEGGVAERRAAGRGVDGASGRLIRAEIPVVARMQPEPMRREVGQQDGAGNRQAATPPQVAGRLRGQVEGRDDLGRRPAADEPAQPGRGQDRQRRGRQRQVRHEEDPVDQRVQPGRGAHHPAVPPAQRRSEPERKQPQDIDDLRFDALGGEPPGQLHRDRVVPGSHTGADDQHSASRWHHDPRDADLTR